MSGKYIYIYVYRYIYIFTSIYLNYHICGFLLIINDFFGSYGEEFFLKFWILARLRWRFGCLPTTKEGKASRGGCCGWKNKGSHVYMYIYIYIYVMSGILPILNSVWWIIRPYLKVNRFILANCGLQLQKLLEDIFTSSMRKISKFGQAFLATCNKKHSFSNCKSSPFNSTMSVKIVSTLNLQLNDVMVGTFRGIPLTDLVPLALGVLVFSICKIWVKQSGRKGFYLYTSFRWRVSIIGSLRLSNMQIQFVVVVVVDVGMSLDKHFHFLGNLRKSPAFWFSKRSRNVISKSENSNP